MSSKIVLAEPQPLSEAVLQHIVGLPLPSSRDLLDYSAFAPSLTLDAIVAAGTHLRHSPDQPLLETPVYLTSEQQGHFASQVLASIINASITRPTNNTEDPAFACLDPTTLGGCAAAEPYFVDAVGKLSPIATGDHPPIADIVTKNGNPVLLSKKARDLGAETCLTLCKITVDGVPYPSGSIAIPVMKTEAREEAWPANGERPYTLHDIRDVRSLGFMRLSMFALPLDERSEWHEAYDEYDEDDSEKIQQTSIQEIISRIRDILDQDKIS